MKVAPTWLSVRRDPLDPERQRKQNTVVAVKTLYRIGIEEFFQIVSLSSSL